jgi:hypothetical protein
MMSTTSVHQARWPCCVLAQRAHVLRVGGGGGDALVKACLKQQRTGVQRTGVQRILWHQYRVLTATASGKPLEHVHRYLLRQFGTEEHAIEQHMQRAVIAIVLVRKHFVPNPNAPVATVGHRDGLLCVHLARRTVDRGVEGLGNPLTDQPFLESLEDLWRCLFLAVATCGDQQIAQWRCEVWWRSGQSASHPTCGVQEHDQRGFSLLLEPVARVAYHRKRVVVTPMDGYK